VVFLTGPRQSGKTTLSRTVFPSFAYVSLEDLQNRRDATEDPRGFLDRLKGAPGAVLDEVQRTPDLFSTIQGYVDDKRLGPLILTGSQQFLLSEKISQSLAGRAAVLELLPLSLAELGRRDALDCEAFPPESPEHAGDALPELDEILFQGMYPAVHGHGLDPYTWYDGYVRTYVERDVRSLSGVGDLETFTRFIGLCAGRSGQLLNASALGSDAGVSHVTAKKWLSILKAGYVLDFLNPHFQNFSKRLIKSPKLHFLDTGLLCHLLGIRQAADLRTHPLRGAIFESFVVSELRKLFIHNGERPRLFFWRDSRGREVDVLIDLGSRLIPVEIKAGATVASDFFKGLDGYGALSGRRSGVLVYGGDESYRRKGHHVLSWKNCT